MLQPDDSNSNLNRIKNLNWPNAYANAGYLHAWTLRIWTQDYGEQIQPVIRVGIDPSASELSNALSARTHCLD